MHLLPANVDPLAITSISAAQIREDQAAVKEPHTLTFAVERMEVAVEAQCPHPKPDSLIGAPACWVLAEDGMPGLGPYLSDECAVMREVRELGTDVLDVPTGKRVRITGDPMRVLWHVEEPAGSHRELWLTPEALLAVAES
jgi:hypothetical protein